MERGKQGIFLLAPFPEQDPVQRSELECESEMQVLVGCEQCSQEGLGCCRNSCHFTAKFSLQFSAEQTPVIYQINPSSGIPGMGLSFNLQCHTDILLIGGFRSEFKVTWEVIHWFWIEKLTGIRPIFPPPISIIFVFPGFFRENWKFDPQSQD